jgi:hypothetical protein
MLDKPEISLITCTQKLWQVCHLRTRVIILIFTRFQIEQRLNIDECMLHAYFTQDAQLYMDLRELEIRLNTRYLVNDADEQRLQLPPCSPNLIF